MAAAVVQAATAPARCTTCSQQAASFASPITAGNTVIVLVWGTHGGVLLTHNVTDDKGNTYTEDILTKDALNNEFAAIYRSSNVVGAGTTVTFHSSSNSILEVTAIEVSGLDNNAPKGTSSNQQTSTSPAPGNLTAGNIMVAAFSNTDNSGTASVTTPGGFSSIYKETNGSGFFVGESVYEITTFAIGPVWTTSNFPWAAVAATYGAAAGGAVSPAQLLALMGVGA